MRRRAETGEGSEVRIPLSDVAIGTVANLRDSIEVAMTHPGTVTEWLVEDGDPVAPGQPIVRLYPAHDSAGAAS